MSEAARSHLTIGERLMSACVYGERLLAGAAFVATFPAAYIAIPAVWHEDVGLAVVTGAALISYAFGAISRVFRVVDDAPRPLSESKQTGE